MDQLELLDSNHGMQSVVSWLRKYLKESRALNRPWQQRARMVKDRLYPLKEYLRTNYSKNLYPNREESEWFKSYVALWKAISQAYAAAKTYRETELTTKPILRRQLQQAITWRTNLALDSFEEFIEKDINHGSNEELINQTPGGPDA